jgi:divalent metal cation (Fe/Co/Zn/Cd) transporter
LDTTVQLAETREHKRLRARMSLAMWTSLVANVLLLAAKIVAYALSHSSSILASAADSFVDIASQAGYLTCALLTATYTSCVADHRTFAIPALPHAT